MAAGVVADTADLVATVTAGDSLPLAGRVLVAAVASGGATLGGLALVRLGPGPTETSADELLMYR